MKRMHLSRSLVPALVIVILGSAGCLLVPDDPVPGERTANLRPSVRIEGGAVTPDPAGVDHQAQFSWSGTDLDGVISSYQWAVDDTVGEGAWHPTAGLTARFRIPAAESRTGARSDPTATDWHTFYVRAIDNGFSISESDKHYFNARTIAPRSRITFPEISESPAPVPATTVVRWEGEDLDSSRPDGKPLAYEYKLARVATMPAPVETYLDSLRDGQNLLDSLGPDPKSRWIRVHSATTQITLPDLPVDGFFVFGVRAIDESEAVEPALDHGRNFFALAVTCGACGVSVKVSEASLGIYWFPVEGRVWETDVPSGVPLRFTWEGDASSYGYRSGMVNYGLDIPDPGDESLHDPHGIGGWIGWGYWRGTQLPITFPADQGGTTHSLYIMMRDLTNSPSSTRRCTVKMKVVPFTFTKTALVVDDARFSSGVYDSTHDAFLDRTILHRLRRLGTVDDVQIWRAWREGGTSPAMLRLEDVKDYRAIVWSLNLGPSIHNGLGIERNEAVLSTYLQAGGRLFMFGTPIVGMNLNQLAYPRDPPATAADQARLYFKFLYMRDEIVSNTLSSGETCLAAKSGLIAARSANPAYPDLFLDPAKWDPEPVVDGEYRGGIRWEGNMLGAGQVPTPYAGLDTLYTVETWNRSIRTLCGTSPSSVEGAIISARYQSTAADTLEGRPHGRVIWFDVQPWWFQEDRLMDAGTAAVNWLFTGRDQ